MTTNDEPDARRRATLGRIARLMAHDFNNTLHLAGGALECLEALAAEGASIEQTRPFLDALRRALTRSKRHISELQPLLRAERCTRALGAVVLRMVSLLAQLRPDARLELAPSSCDLGTALDTDEALLAELLLLLIDAARIPHARLETYALAGELSLLVHLSGFDASAPHTDLRELAHLCGAHLELAHDRVTVQWPASGLEPLGHEDLLVLVVGAPRPSGALVRTLREADIAALDACDADALEELIGDYGDELDLVLLTDRRAAWSLLGDHLSELPRVVCSEPAEAVRDVADATWRERIIARLRQTRGAVEK